MEIEVTEQTDKVNKTFDFVNKNIITVKPLY